MRECIWCFRDICSVITAFAKRNVRCIALPYQQRCPHFTYKKEPYEMLISTLTEKQSGKLFKLGIDTSKASVAYPVNSAYRTSGIAVKKVFSIQDLLELLQKTIDILQEEHNNHFIEDDSAFTELIINYCEGKWIVKLFNAEKYIGVPQIESEECDTLIDALYEVLKQVLKEKLVNPYSLC